MALTMLQALIPPTLLRGICFFCELPLFKVKDLSSEVQYRLLELPESPAVSC